VYTCLIVMLENLLIEIDNKRKNNVKTLLYKTNTLCSESKTKFLNVERR